MSQVLEKIRKALGSQPGDDRAAAVFAKSDDFVRCAGQNVSAENQAGWMESIRTEAKALNLHVHESVTLAACAQDIVALAKERAPEWGSVKQIMRWSDPLLTELDLESCLPSEITLKTVPVAESFSDVERQTFRKDVIDSYIGITTADFLLADTASLVLLGGRGRARSVSLVPSIHIAVVPASRMLGSYRQMLSCLNGLALPSNVSIITGPSKTADIEATLVHGAHGPREMHLFVIAD